MNPGFFASWVPWYPDEADPTGKFCRVRVRPLEPAPREVTLKAIRADGRFADLALIRQSRLSVMPVSDEHWSLLRGMAGLGA